MPYKISYPNKKFFVIYNTMQITRSPNNFSTFRHLLGITFVQLRLLQALSLLSDIPVQSNSARAKR